jgi:septum formation protein
VDTLAGFFEWLLIAPKTVAAMILDILPALRSKRLLLASASPRRRDLLLQLGLAVEVRPSAFAETLSKQGVTPQQYVTATARGKALDVLNALSVSQMPDFIVSSDTIVVSAGEILEKPAGPDDARRMMRLLSGSTHHVMTAVCVISPARPTRPTAVWSVETVVAACGEERVLTSFVEEAAVTFAPLPPALIDAYVATDEPYDKAGGYGIQGTAAQFISGITGDFYCVVGFPVHAFCALLRALVVT